MPLFHLPPSYYQAFPRVETKSWADFATQGTGTCTDVWANWPQFNESLRSGGGRIVEFIWGPHDVKGMSKAAFRRLEEDYKNFRFMFPGRGFVTMRDGRFGWVPENVLSLDQDATAVRQLDQFRCGDLFAILFGCEVLLIIRKCGNGFKVLREGFLEGFYEWRVPG